MSAAIPDPITDVETKTRWFTFGQGHVHEVHSKTFDKDCVVQITATDPRGVMFALFKRRWSHEYDLPPDMSLYPNGMHLIP